MKNQYSHTWFDLFLKDYNQERTRKEVEFIMHFLKNPDASILDIACGNGRHAIPLSERGYHVTGIDNNKAVIDSFFSKNSTVDIRLLDMQNLITLDQEFDGILLLWQSWGYHSSQINNRILSDIHKILVPNGIFIIDIYNKDFFKHNLSPREILKGNERIVEKKSLEDDRLDVILEYQNKGTSDHFNWQIFTPVEFENMAEKLNFDIVSSHSSFELNKKPSSTFPRMQFVLTRS